MTHELRSGVGPRADVARRVRDGLRHEIRAGRFRHGVLPSEGALMLSYGASRNAIRLALDLLRDEGLVQRVQGVGTLVTHDGWTCVPVDEPIGLEEVLQGDAARATYRTLAALVVPAPPGVADRLQVQLGAPVVFHERVALLDHEPLTLRSAWIPIDIGAPIVEGLVELRRGIFDVLEVGLGLELGLTEFSIEASLADETVAAILTVRPGSAVLLIESLTHSVDGRPVEFGYGRSRADRVRLARQAHRESIPGIQTPVAVCDPTT